MVAGVSMTALTAMGAAVPTSVEQAVDPALLVAAKNHRPAGHLAGAEVARLLQLGCVAHIYPAAAENVGHFLAQDVLGDQNLAVQKERLSFAVIDDVGAR